MKYIKRIIDNEIKEKLSIMGAIVIKGPKWCGKTTSAKQIAKSVLEMQNPDLQENYIELANTKPSLLLEGEKPRLIDEWQLAPKLWNAVRYSVDEIGLPNQYILTGSSTPVEDSSLHSGVGRFAFVTMKPMTLFESGDSNGKISLSDILNGNREIGRILLTLLKKLNFQNLNIEAVINHSDILGKENFRLNLNKELENNPKLGGVFKEYNDFFNLNYSSIMILKLFFYGEKRI